MTLKNDITSAGARVVVQVGDGDADGAARLVERYGTALMAMLLHWTGNKDTAAALYQESFCVLFERLGSTGLQKPEKCGGYLHQIARNLAKDDHRQNLKRNATDALTDTDRLSAPEPSAEEMLLHSQRAQVIHDLLKEISTPRDREILTRFYINEETKESVCETLGLSNEHFNRVLHRARMRFKTLLLRTGLHKSI